MRSSTEQCNFERNLLTACISTVVKNTQLKNNMYLSIYNYFNKNTYYCSLLKFLLY